MAKAKSLRCLLDLFEENAGREAARGLEFQLLVGCEKCGRRVVKPDLSGPLNPDNGVVILQVAEVKAETFVVYCRKCFDSLL